MSSLDEQRTATPGLTVIPESVTPPPRSEIAVTAIDLRGVHKSLASVQAVREVDLTIQRGEVVAFLGPNGAGKTSTIDMILGLSRPSAGEVHVLGMPPRRVITKGLVAAVMQTGGLLKDLTVPEAVRYTSKLFAVGRPIGEVMERAGITHIADRLVGKRSGGEQNACVSLWRCRPTPNCFSSTSRPRGWTSRDDGSFGRPSATTRPGPHDRVCHPLPRRSRRLRRPGGVDHQRPDRRRRNRVGGQSRGLRADHSNHPVGSRRGPPARHARRGDVEIRGETVPIHSNDTDSVARRLLNDTEAHDLQITSRGLEDAFLALTTDTDDSAPMTKVVR